MYIHQNASHFSEIKIHPKLTLILVLAAIALALIMQNSPEVEVNFLLWKISISTSALVFCMVALGTGLGWFMHSYLLYRKYKRDSVYFTIRKH